MDIFPANPKLTEAEQQVVAYLSAHADEIPHLTITDISERAFVSPSTVSRAIRKCGYACLADMRYKLAARDSSQPTLALFNQILNKSYEECTRTIENIRVESILKITDMIRRAGKIFLISCCMTSVVAREFELLLETQKLNVWSISDIPVLRRMDKLVTPDDLVMILTVNNTAPELEIAARQSRECGAGVVVCCCKPDTPLEQYADVCVVGYSQSIASESVLSNPSRLGLQIITRTIAEYLSN